jgi:single-strand DNA-binding protein
MYNRIILIGRLTRDPELQYLGADGIPAARFSLAVNRPFRAQDGAQQTDFIDCVAWRKLAEQVSQYATKGRLVALEGRLQIRTYEQDGQRRRAAEVVADTVRFLDSSKPAGGNAQPPGEPAPAGDGAQP